MGASLAASAYRHPDLFDGLNTLDLMEICGSMAAAAGPLNLSQPTISRRYQQLCKDFGLEKTSGHCMDRLRYGETESIRLLRNAFQSHRLAAGVLRIGVDPLRQSLLGNSRQLLAVPPHFRHARTLHRQVRSHILDGALLSSLEITALWPDQSNSPDEVAWPKQTLSAKPLSSQKPSQYQDPWCCTQESLFIEGSLLIPLGCWPLGLVVPAGVEVLPPRWSDVVVPPINLAPGLAASVRQQQWTARQAPQDLTGANDWRHWLEREHLPCIATPGWFIALSRCGPELGWLELDKPMGEQLWLLVNPKPWAEYPALAELTKTIRASIETFHAFLAYSTRQKGGHLPG